MAVQIDTHSSGVLVAFINGNHSKTSNILLNQDILKNHYGIVFINKPYYNIQGVPLFDKNFNIIAYQDNPRTAIIVVNKNYKYTIIHIERDLIVINMEINKDSIILLMYIFHHPNL